MRLSGYGGRARGDRTLRAGVGFFRRQGFVIFRVNMLTRLFFSSLRRRLSLERR
jgi:hypothetical protein